MADYGGQSQQHQGPAPPYPYQEQPLQGQRSGEYAPYPEVNRNDDQRYGTPVMGAPSNPSAHPDNQSAATGSFSSRSSGSYHDDPVHANKAQTGASVPGQQVPPQAAPAQGTSTAPGAAGTTPARGNSMDQFKVQVAEFSKKAELAMNNMWGHLSTGGNPAENAWGRVTAGTQLLTKGGFEGVFKKTFSPVEADEKLKKTYACFLSTSTGPVAGTLYITNKRLAFCSDRPLSYTPASGAPQAAKPGKPGQGGPQQSYSYYKVIVPVNKVKEVNPSMNESKAAEKYIQIKTQDDFEFWFMGFVNYDKGVKNLQSVLVGGGGGQQQPTPGIPEQQQSYSPNQEGQQTYPPNQEGQQTYPPNQQQHQTYPPNQGQQQSYQGQQQSYPPNQSYEQPYPPQQGQGGGGYQQQQSYQGGGGYQQQQQQQQPYPHMSNQPSFSPNNYGTAPRYDS